MVALYSSHSLSKPTVFVTHASKHDQNCCLWQSRPANLCACFWQGSNSRSGSKLIASSWGDFIEEKMLSELHQFI